jgi:glycerophosphoryl diester phosphodiesterase
MSKTLIFAHRGANRQAAENTRSAFDKALEYPVDGMETDVQLSRDEVAVLWHDRFLGKVGRPLHHIDDFDYEQLQAMDFAAHFSPDVHGSNVTLDNKTRHAHFPLPNPLPQACEGANELLRKFHVKAGHESLMTLQAFLDAYRRRCRLLIEIKHRDWESRERLEIKVRQTLEMIGEVNDDAIMVSSFNLESLIYAHSCAPDFPLIYNLETGQMMKQAQCALFEQPYLYGLCLPIATLDEAIVKLLRDEGKCIAVYTCDTDAEINKALELGVDILISDLPQKALQMRDRELAVR